MLDFSTSCKECKCIETIVNIGKELLTQFDIEKILHSFHNQINTILQVPLIAIGVSNDENSELHFWGMDAETHRIRKGSISLNTVNNWAVRSFLNTEEIVISNTHNQSHMSFSKILFHVEDSQRKSFLYIPLVSRNKTIGVLTLQSFAPQIFNTAQVNFVRTIANYMSIAIENAQYFSEIQLQKNELSALIDNMEDIIIARTNEIHQKNKELEKLSIVAKKTENAIMIMDASGNIVWINEYFTKIYGYTLSQFIETRGSNLLQTSFNKDIKKILKTCQQEKKAIMYEALNTKYDGEKIWTQTSLTPIVNSNNDITHLVTIDTDISKIKEAEKDISDKNNEIMQSIQYASRIQKAAFPSKEYISKILPKHFIFHQPLDIVSGDFYWIKKKYSVSILAVGDCTGHGVPGALLSMLGCSFLEDIANNYTKESAADILHKLQMLFEQRMQQSVMGSEVVDGMDISICIIHHTKGILEFAGANQDLIMIKHNTLHQIKGNRMCIGGQSQKNYLFQNHTIHIDSQQFFYLFSDGFSSQFGGVQGKKYMKKQLLQTLLNIHKIHFSEQNKILRNILTSWMGNKHQQIDDILVMGFSLD